jgi:hypothetical protein
MVRLRNAKKITEVCNDCGKKITDLNDLYERWIMSDRGDTLIDSFVCNICDDCQEIAEKSNIHVEHIWIGDD